MTVLDRLTARARGQTPRPGSTDARPPGGRRCAGMRAHARSTPWRPRTILIVGLAGFALTTSCVVNPVAALAAAGTGFFNIVGGGGAIITFLAVTALGVPALTAHATGQFVTPMSFLTMIGRARHHSPGRGLLATAGLGTAVGVVILKLTPPTTVQLVAPAFLAAAGVLVVIQDPVQRRIHRIGWELGRNTTLVLLFGVGIYAGMIGVGTGTLALVVLGLTRRYARVDLQQLILTRNVLLLGMAGVVSAAFIPTGLVDWRLALVLALPGAVGGWIGIKLIHRLPVPVLRASIAGTAGVGAGWMWLT